MPKKIIVLLFCFFVISLTAPLVCADATDNIETNLGASVSDIIMIIVSCGVIVLCAFDLRIALMLAFLLYASLFIVFSLATEVGYDGFNPYYAGVAMMACFVLLALSLLITYKKVNSPPSGVA